MSLIKRFKNLWSLSKGEHYIYSNLADLDFQQTENQKVKDHQQAVIIKKKDNRIEEITNGK